MTRPVDALFQPLTFGTRQLRNRIAMAPMTRKRSPGGVPNAQNLAYYRRRSAGGVGLIVSEGTFIDHPAAGALDPPSYENIPHFFGEAALAGWKAVLDAVHESGAAMIPQLWHIGEVRRAGMGPDPAVPGLGPRRLEAAGRLLVKAMDEADVEAVAAAYARGARAAQALGFDGVAIHGAHGYLLDQFLWPALNARGDAYGGAMENRSRLAARVVAAMRAAVGPGFPIVLRFSQWKMSDYEARIAETPAELEVFLKLMVAAGVDVFDVSTRRFWEPAFAGSPLSLAAWTRRLSGKPVIAVGSIGLDQPHQSKLFRDKTTIDAKVTDLDRVMESLERQDFDLAAVGRAILSDPGWAGKVRAGRMDSIQPFVRGALESYL